MTKEETIKVLQSIEDRAADFPYMTACDWVAIAAAKRHLKNSIEAKESEDEKIRQFLIHEVTETSDEIMSYRNMNKKDVLAWLEKHGEKGTNGNDREIPNSAWNEEDEYLLDETIQHLEELIRIDKVKYCGVDAQYYQRDIDWLKSLRPQNKYAYNPYKAIVESIAAMVEKYAPFDSNLQDFYDNVKVKCKDAKEYDSLYPH